MRTADTPGYEEFLAQYLRANQPVILPRTLVQGWPALKRWGGDFWAVLEADYGEQSVPVVVDDRRDMRLGDAVAVVRERKCPVYIKDWHLVRDSRDGSDHASDRQLPYWTPSIFADDCACALTGMNNVTPQAKGAYPYGPDCWLRANTDGYAVDDFRFCYAGTAGSSTTLHRDGVYSR